MTPAIECARKAGIAYKVLAYDHDPRSTAWGTEAAERLGLPPEQVFKTLLVSLESDPRRLAVGVVPVSTQLGLKALARALGARKAALAEMKDAERATGYVAGGISPLGQKKRLPLVLDASAARLETLFVSAGRRGLEIGLAPSDLLRITGGRLAPITG
jgi:Cys-tRNA(Pro)/Cys-tRNA(Cys) deacylase